MFAVVLVAGTLAVLLMFKSATRYAALADRGRVSGQTASFVAAVGSPVMMEDAAFGAAGVPAPAPMPPEAAARKGTDVSAAGRNDAEPQRIIKTGQLTLRVADAPKAVEDVRAAVTAKGGFVESSSLSDNGAGPRSAWMTVRVPVASFEATMDDLKRVSVLVLNETVHGQDVTEQFVDLEADLRNARAEEASYLEILKRSGDIEDVLAVTQRLADVRGRIERLEGRKRYLENRTDFATISVTLTEETRVEVPTRTWKPLEVLRTALRDLVVSLQGLVDFLIRFVIAVVGLLLPIGIIVAVIIWIGWKVVRAFVRRLGK